MRFWVWILTSLLSLSANASLQALDATYVVNAFGADIGESRQMLRCDATGPCHLKAETHPVGIAKLFTNERLLEQSEFKLGTELQWQRYEKRKFDGDRLVRTVTLIRTSQGVLYQQINRRFPQRENLFDALSLPFALGRWPAPPEALYLQDNNWQDRLTPTRWAEPVRLAGRAARYYSLHGPHAKVEVWLDDETRAIPLKVVVHNLESDKTITLTLKKERHTSHAPQ